MRAWAREQHINADGNVINADGNADADDRVGVRANGETIAYYAEMRVAYLNTMKYNVISI